MNSLLLFLSWIVVETQGKQKADHTETGRESSANSPKWRSASEAGFMAVRVSSKGRFILGVLLEEAGLRSVDKGLALQTQRPEIYPQKHMNMHLKQNHTKPNMAFIPTLETLKQGDS